MFPDVKTCLRIIWWKKYKIYPKMQHSCFFCWNKLEGQPWCIVWNHRIFNDDIRLLLNHFLQNIIWKENTSSNFLLALYSPLNLKIIHPFNCIWHVIGYALFCLGIFMYFGYPKIYNKKPMLLTSSGYGKGTSSWQTWGGIHVTRDVLFDSI